MSIVVPEYHCDCLHVQLVAGDVHSYGYTDTFSFIDPYGKHKRRNTSCNTRFFGPRGLALDRAGNLFIADCDNQVIRKIDTAGQVTTVAGQFETSGSSDGCKPLFYSPSSCTVDKDNSLLVVQHVLSGSLPGTIRRIRQGITTSIESFAVDPLASYDGATEAEIELPWSIKATPDGNILLVDCLGILLIHDDTIVNIFGKVHQLGYLDGPVSSALFNAVDAAMDNEGSILVAENSNNAIRKISNNFVTTFAKIKSPISIAISQDNTIFVACTLELVGFSPDGKIMWCLSLNKGYGVAIDFTGVYFTDGHAIKKIPFMVAWKKRSSLYFSEYS